MVEACALWEIATHCELSNWMTMILELTIAGFVAIVLSLFFYTKQSSFAIKLFEVENRPKLESSYEDYFPRKGSVWEPFSIRLYVKNTGLTDAIIDQTTIEFETDGMKISMNFEYEDNVYSIPSDDSKTPQYLIHPLEKDHPLFKKGKGLNQIDIWIKYKSENSNKLYSHRHLIDRKKIDENMSNF